MAIKYVTAGESHGKMLVGIMENVPAGLFVDVDFLNGELKRRTLGLGRGARMQIEDDRAQIVAGVRARRTTGAPIAVTVENADHKNWSRTIGIDAEDTDRAITAVRPGHADLAGAVKYGFTDARNVAERASARTTAMTVALGGIAKLYLGALGITVESHTVAIGIAKARECRDYTDINARADIDRVRCLDPEASERMANEIRLAAISGDTLGGVSEIVVSGCIAGIGSFVSSDRRLDGLLAGAVAAVPSVKAVEIGDGIAGSGVYGSAFHDAVYIRDGRYSRDTNRAGGIEGGMTNGERIIIRAYFKPIPSLKNGLDSVDISSGKSAKGASERGDTCCVPAGGVVCEHAVALVLAQAISDMLGGDTMSETVARYGIKGGKRE